MELSESLTSIVPQPSSHHENLGFQSSDRPSISIGDQLESLSLQDNRHSSSNNDSSKDEHKDAEDERIEEVSHNEVYDVASDEGENDNWQLATDDMDEMREWGTYNYCDSWGEDEERGQENGDLYAWSEDEKEQELLWELEEEEGYRKRDTQFQFPVRPKDGDCPYYMRTGNCKFGVNCKFNHPPRRKSQAVMETETDKERGNKPVEKANPSNCKFYDSPGGCKFGKACRFNHNKKSPATTRASEFNSIGLPIRVGEKECPYYMRNGSCKFGKSCKFNHPDATVVGRSDAFSVYGSGGSFASQASSRHLAHWSAPAPLNNNTLFPPFMFPRAQAAPTSPEWNTHQSPVFSPEMNMMPPYLVRSPVPDANIYMQQQELSVDEFPERPGQPDCSYYLRTGNCKYGSACKFHHPKNRIPKSPPCTLSDFGLPLRPGQTICSYYSRYGICKFGPACKYDHPLENPLLVPPAMPGTGRRPSVSNSWTDDEAEPGPVGADGES